MPRKKKEPVAVPSLSSLCIKVIASNFKDLPVAHLVSDKARFQLLKVLPLDVDIKTAGEHVHDEAYWERRCKANERWKYFELDKHGYTWKQCFFEKSLQDRLHDFAKGDDRGALLADIEASSDFVHSLNIEQLQSHLDLDDLFENLGNLSHLSLTYGAQKLRMNFKRELFGMKFSDAESLSVCLENTQTLVSLSLRSNLLDDDLVEILMEGLSQNKTLSILDLSHNKISDTGAQMLGEYLSQPCTVVHLDLADNQIYGEGGLHLGRALHYNDTLVSLNLRLNRLGDMGGRVLLDGLVENDTLRSVNLGSNSLAEETTKMLSALFKSSTCVLQHLDLSSNDLTEVEGNELHNALSNNVTLVNLDLRHNRIEEGSACVGAIVEILKRNELRARGRP